MNLKINKIEIISMFFFGLLFYPRFLDYLNDEKILKIIYGLQAILSILFLGMFFLKKFIQKNLCFDKNIFLLVAFFLSYMFSDYMNNTTFDSISVLLRKILTILGIYSFLNLYYPRFKKNVLQGIYIYLLLILFINIICFIMFPTGLTSMNMVNDMGYIVWSDRMNFLDADNRISFYVLLQLFITHVYINNYPLEKNKIIKVSYAVGLLNIFLSKSGSGIIAILVFMLIMIFDKYNLTFLKKFDWKKISVFIFFVLLFVFGKLNFIITQISSLMGKGVTLHGRTVIWKQAIDKISQSFLFGYGTGDEGALFHIGNYTWYAHNQYLDILIQGGITALLLFIWCLLCYSKKIYLRSSRKENNVYIAILSSFLILGLVEHFLLRNYYQFFVFILLAYTNSYTRSKENNVGGNTIEYA